MSRVKNLILVGAISIAALSGVVLSGTSAGAQQSMEDVKQQQERARKMPPEEIGEQVPKPQPAQGYAKPEKQNAAAETPPNPSSQAATDESHSDRRPEFQREEEYLQAFSIGAALVGLLIVFLVWRHYQNPENYMDDEEEAGESAEQSSQPSEAQPTAANTDSGARAESAGAA
ncbi:MAG TPA: hypothetical protein V6C72_17055 [Chroococcales cyanobacterium]